MLGITERFYTNGLENRHKLQKRSIKEAGIHKEVVAIKGMGLLSGSRTCFI